MMFSTYLGGDKFLSTSTPLRWAKDSTTARSTEDSGYFGSCGRDDRLRRETSRNEGTSSSDASSGTSTPFSNPDASGERDVRHLRIPPRIEFSDSIEDGSWIVCPPVPSRCCEALEESELHFKRRFDVRARMESNLKNLLDARTRTEMNLKNTLGTPRTESSRRRRKHVDFFKELSERNCPRLISMILGELSAEDLRRASCVGKGWNEAITRDRRANQRRKKSVLEAKRRRVLALSQKENRLGRHLVEEREHKTAFCDITNEPRLKKQPLRSETGGRFDSYLQVAGTLAEGEVLSKCPQCRFASRPRSGNYECTGCSYVFCAKCRGPASGGHTCGGTEVPSILIGSKRSRRNLKRL